MTYTKKVSEILPLMQNIENIRNVGILAHIDHGKTTLSDNLLAYCGLLSHSLAGEARALDYLEEEQKRGITIKSANISLPYKSKDQLYLINLVDTPGHVDFSSARDQSLRAIDGAIIVVDAVEGCMVQTEIVTKQALEEYIKPILFINKVDRLITELKLSLKEIEKKFNEIIQDFNNFVELYAPDNFKERWKIEVQQGNVAFGSALHLWGCNAKEMLHQNIKFRDIVEIYQNSSIDKGKFRELQKKIPLGKNILEIIINHLPNPHSAQRYRIPALWQGDLSSEIGQSLLNCESNGPMLLYLYKNDFDKNHGIISVGRIFSGTIQIGQEIFSLINHEYERLQQLVLFMGAHRESLKSVPTGNIVAFVLNNPKIGDTLVSKNYEDTAPFEQIKYETEPVVQYSIEPMHPRELKKMLKLLEKFSLNDPNLKVLTNEETGEILISGLGELHLDIITNDLRKEGIDIIVSEPIITYRETIPEKSANISVKSPDSKDSITIQVEPLESQLIDLLTSGQLNIKMSKNRRRQILRKFTTWDENLIQKIFYFDAFGNIILWFVDKYNLEEIGEITPLIHHNIEKIFRFGPLIRDPIRGLKVKILDLSLEFKASQFDLLQIVPLLKEAITQAFQLSKAVILQPIYKIQIKTISTYIGAINSIITQSNGKILQMEQKGKDIFIIGQIPVKNTFGLASKLRSKTSGHVFYMTFFSHWEKILPESYMEELIQEIRTKRGLS